MKLISRKINKLIKVHLPEYLAQSVGRFCAVLLVVFCFYTPIFAQHTILDRLNITESQGKVYINCVISEGNTCNGIVIYRSVDSLNFEVIGKIYGVCGSLNTPTGYYYTDETPVKNKTNYYKLELGGQGFTDVVSVLIIDTEISDFLIKPNPANITAKVFFNNDKNQETELNLYNQIGQIVLKDKASTNNFKLDVSNLPSGLYLIELKQENLRYKSIGKLMIVHN